MQKEVVASLAEKYPDDTDAIKVILHDLEYDAMREMILANGKRLDGRGLRDIRPIVIEVGLLPRTHGSALFQRGETQSLTTLTLGTKLDEQIIDGLLPEHSKRFMLHYNFPPFSVGEVGRLGTTGRREIGHGNLAERSIRIMMPAESDFPYTVRLVSDILESNGSSSMATVCAATLALLDGGAPLKKPVAGIAMGLVKEQDRVAILSDILGNEDHLGDMDFKVAGTKDGITACQMDIKIRGISLDIMRNALEQAREGRMHILGKMAETHLDAACGSFAVCTASDHPEDPHRHDRCVDRTGRKEHPQDRRGERRADQHRRRRFRCHRCDLQGSGGQGDRCDQPDHGSARGRQGLHLPR